MDKYPTWSDGVEDGMNDRPCRFPEWNDYLMGWRFGFWTVSKRERY